MFCFWYFTRLVWISLIFVSKSLTFWETVLNFGLSEGVICIFTGLISKLTLFAPVTYKLILDPRDITKPAFVHPITSKHPLTPPHMPKWANTHPLAYEPPVFSACQHPKFCRFTLLAIWATAGPQASPVYTPPSQVPVSGPAPFYRQHSKSRHLIVHDFP